MPETKSNCEKASPNYPALALILFFAGALLSLEAKHFGCPVSVNSPLSVMWALLFTAGVLQLSVSALLLLPLSAFIFGAAAAMETQMILSGGEPLRITELIPLLLQVPLFFLLFCRGMTQGTLLRRQVLLAHGFDRREPVFSFGMMFAPAALILLERFIINRN